ncbi:MAG: LicD family protein [Lachnospiraceae bacterium]|nr:LicD family protein [Lachnospiraceae bacterium]
MVDNVSRLRKVELELLEVFIDVCEEHNLKWYAFLGTLLGIQRNGGFLPWDDDIDVAMPMMDYLNLCEHREWFDTEKYLLQVPQDLGLCRFAKLRKNGTTAFREEFLDCLKTEGHQGISIDIIPLAELPGMGAYHTPTLLNKEKKEAVYLKSWFEPAGTGMFEGMQMRIPAMPRKILNEVYGEWAWPHGVRESRPSCWFFDTERGYEGYIRRYTGMLEGIEGKKILLFGAADSLRIWLERFNLRGQVVCAFDNFSGKWGKELYGVEIKNPAELPALADKDSRVIIVSLWHQEIGRQLEGMGIDDYYVYIDEYYDEKIGNKVVRREDLKDGDKKFARWE